MLWKVKGSVDVEYQKSIDGCTSTSEKTKIAKSLCIGYYCGGGLRIDQDNIILNDNVKDKFWSLFEQFKKKVDKD